MFRSQSGNKRGNQLTCFFKKLKLKHDTFKRQASSHATEWNLKQVQYTVYTQQQQRNVAWDIYVTRKLRNESGLHNNLNTC